MQSGTEEKAGFGFWVVVARRMEAGPALQAAMPECGLPASINPLLSLRHALPVARVILHSVAQTLCGSHITTSPSARAA